MRSTRGPAPTLIFTPGDVEAGTARERLIAGVRNVLQDADARIAAQVQEAMSMVLGAMADPDYDGERVMARAGRQPLLRLLPAPRGERPALYVAPIGWAPLPPAGESR